MEKVYSSQCDLSFEVVCLGRHFLCYCLRMLMGTSLTRLGMESMISDMVLLWKREKRVGKGTGTKDRREVNWLQTEDQDSGIKDLFMLGIKGTEGNMSVFHSNKPYATNFWTPLAPLNDQETPAV